MKYLCRECKKIALTDDSNAGKMVLCSCCGKETEVPAGIFSPGSVIAEFEIIRFFRKGDMGDIYLAKHLPTGMISALKVLAPEHSYDAKFIVSFIRQGRNAGKKDFPNTVKVISVGEENGFFYYAMEFVEGQSLADLLRNGPLPLKNAIDIIQKLAALLDDAWQSHKIVHRSIKPDNILIASDGEIKLADFGLARDYLNLTDRSEEEKLRLIQYVSPECLSDFSMSNLGIQSDIYSLGAVFYHAVTGRYPYVGFSVAEIISEQIPVTPLSPSQINPEIPEALSSVILRMMARHSGKRYQKYSELLDSLRSIKLEIPQEEKVLEQKKCGTCKSEESKTVQISGAVRSRSVLSLTGKKEKVSTQLDTMQKRREARSKRIVFMISFALLATVIVFTLFIRWLVHEPQASTRAMEINIARMKELAARRKSFSKPLKPGAPELLCRGVVAFCSNEDFASAQKYVQDFSRKYPVDPELSGMLLRHIRNARIFFVTLSNGGNKVYGLDFHSETHGHCRVLSVNEYEIKAEKMSGELVTIQLRALSHREYMDYLYTISTAYGLTEQLRSYLACTGSFDLAIQLSPDEEEQREFKQIAYSYIRSGIVNASPVEIRHLRMLYGSSGAFRKAMNSN